MKRKTVFTVFGLLIVFSMLLAACAKTGTESPGGFSQGYLHLWPGR